MANFDNFKAMVVELWGSLASYVGGLAAVPFHLGAEVRNACYTQNTIRTRDGIELAMKPPDGSDTGRMTGLACLVFIDTTKSQIPVGFDSNGKLWKEYPVGSGPDAAMTEITGALVTMPASAYMECAAVFNRLYMVFGDLIHGTAFGAVLDGASGRLEPLSGRRVGEPWGQGSYVIGEVICPTTGNGHAYRCTTAGASGAVEPVWPVTVGGTINDGTCVWTETTAVGADDTVGGNICAGTRNFVVLFENNNGYITGWAEGAVFSWTAAGSKRAVMTVVPLGPSNTARRIIAFPVADDTNVGPFFYIPENDTIEGVTNTRTTIEDNVTTTATFNFTDDYLVTGIDVTGYINKFRVPECVSIYYDPTLNRMVYWGADGDESAFFMSDPNDPETVRQLLEVSEGDGQRAIAWREYDGQHFAYKERGGYMINPDGTDTGQWGEKRLWAKTGPSGPRAVDVNGRFHAYAHRSGAYLYTSGEPTWVSEEIQDDWNNINWKYGHLIHVLIDEENSCVYFQVPYGDATVPNKRFTLSYLLGIEDPQVRTMFGKYIANHQGRRWSIDDIEATMCVRAERLLPIAPEVDGQNDHYTEQTQLLLASSNPDGAINMVRPNARTDNGHGIGFVYSTGTADAQGAALAYGGVRVKCHGDGSIFITRIRNDGRTELLRKDGIPISEVETEYSIGAGPGESSGWRTRISTEKKDGAWVELSRLSVFVQPVAQSGGK